MSSRRGRGGNDHPSPRLRRPAATSRRQISSRDGSRWLALCDGPASRRSSRALCAFSEGIAAQAEQTFKNLKTIVEAAGFALSDTVFVRIYLTHFERDFDGFNAVYHRYFADDEQVPSRTTIGVAKLGRDALVEVDLVLYRQAAK